MLLPIADNIRLDPRANQPSVAYLYRTHTQTSHSSVSITTPTGKLTIGFVSLSHVVNDIGGEGCFRGIIGKVMKYVGVLRGVRAVPDNDY